MLCFPVKSWNVASRNLLINIKSQYQDTICSEAEEGDGDGHYL